MREIKFRGLTINGEWVFGLPAISTGLPGQPEKGAYIANQAGAVWAFQIRPETLGEFTGLKDKNGKEIYEGDVVEGKHPHKGRYHKGEVVFVGYRFTLKNFYWAHFDCPDEPFSEGTEYWEVIGNVHENPELIGNRSK